MILIITILILWIFYHLGVIEFDNKPFKSIILLYKVITIRSSDIIYYNDYNSCIRIELLRSNSALWLDGTFTRIMKRKCDKFYSKHNRIYFNVDYIDYIDISDDCIFFINGYIYYNNTNRLDIEDLQELQYIIRERKLKKLGF